MIFNYDASTDSLYITLAERPSVDSEEIGPNVIGDFDAAGALVGLDIQHASATVNLSKLETHALPAVLLATAV